MTLLDAGQFMSENNTCVLATISDQGVPSAARVGFSHDDKFQILIATHTSTRKYKNLLKNSNVALVIGDDNKRTLQYEGVAKEISRENLGDRLELHYAKLPGARHYLNTEGQVFFLIEPTWLRYTTEYGASPVIFETREF